MEERSCHSTQQWTNKLQSLLGTLANLKNSHLKWRNDDQHFSEHIILWVWFLRSIRVTYNLKGLKNTGSPVNEMIIKKLF